MSPPFQILGRKSQIKLRTQNLAGAENEKFLRKVFKRSLVQKRFLQTSKKRS